MLEFLNLIAYLDEQVIENTIKATEEINGTRDGLNVKSVQRLTTLPTKPQ
ncbi:MAG: hypothetical protein NUV76_05360 [Candidatus Kuenenia sp.]|nr:hypothetical protein [Candidatus Kuenenia sp.]